MADPRKLVEEITLAQTVAAMPTASLIADDEYRVVFVNPAFERLTGYRLDELRGKNCGLLQVRETERSTVAEARRSVSRGMSFFGEFLVQRRNGEQFWDGVMINPIADSAGKVIGSFSAHSDVTGQVTERDTVADRLGTAEMLLGGLRRFTSADPVEVAEALCDVTVQAGAPVAVLVADPDSEPRVVAWSGTPEQPLDAAGASVLIDAVRVGGRAQDLLWLHSSDPSRGQQDELHELGLEHAAVVRIRPRAGTDVVLLALWSRGSSAPAGDRDAVGDRVGRLAELGGLALDNLDLIDRIRASAQRDDLTGLLSRAAVQAQLEDALRTGPQSAAVLYLDVDRFKRINDSLGHAGGDALLVQIARRIEAAVGSTGTVGRLGGDEFLVVLPAADDAAAIDAERAIAASMRPPFEVADRPVFASMSAGRALGRLTEHEGARASAARMVQEADAAMYAAKRRNRVRRHVDTHLDLLAVEADLHHALEHDEITTWFQPQYDGRTGRLVGFEALARWKHYTLGWVGPGVFIPIAEEAGLIAEVGRRVLRDAVDFARAHARHLDASNICVNVSRSELLSSEYVEELAALLSGRGSEGWTLTLEVKEPDLADEPGVIKDTLISLRRLGVALTIDNFGSGSSSLRLLQDLPVTAVKIDQAILSRPGALGEQMLTAIVNLGLQLGLEVKAEGVETQTQLDALRRLGCGSLQGYLLAPAAPAARAAGAARSLAGALRTMERTDSPF